jgi:phospholipid/cholesterol/gamma-HCH transport system substrate-binding protein
MKRRMVWAQLAIFGVISILVTAYTVFDVMGVDAGPGPYRVVVQLENGGGIFPGAEVALRGVQIGRVKSVSVHADGVTVALDIDHGRKVRANSVAHVYDLSAVGEQYVDFVPKSDSGPYLHDGSVVPESQTTTPLAVPTVLYDLEQFVSSLDADDVRTLTTQLAAAFRDTGPQLRSILVNGAQLVDQLSASQQATLDLLHNANVVLHTADTHAGDFATFARSLQQLSATLAAKTPALDALLAQSAATTTLLDDVITENASAASVLLADLATISQIQVARVPALRSLLVAVPRFGEVVPTVVRDGVLQIVIYVNGHQQVCQYGSALTSPLSGTRSPLHNGDCPTLKPGELVRGAANAPRPSAQTTADGTQVAQYDPLTGDATAADGSQVQLGWNGGQQGLLGAGSWRALLASTAGS